MSFLQKLSYYRRYRRAEAELPLEDYLLPDAGVTQERLQSGQYPTPQSLAATRDSLGEAPRAPDSHKHSSPTPSPFPSRRSKAELLRGVEFSSVDAQAQSELPVPNDDWSTLCRRLYRGCDDDLKRLRAAFAFVLAMSVSGRAKLIKADAGLESPVYRTLRRLAESGSSSGVDRHSTVFARLLSEAGVPFERIVGFKKGVGLAPGFRTPLGGCWFACYVCGEWRLVDISWAAQTADGDNDASEFFFMTDPEQFIVTHQPFELRPFQDDGESTRVDKQIDEKLNETENNETNLPEDTAISRQSKKKQQQQMEHQQQQLKNVTNTSSVAAWQLLSRPLTRSEFDRLPVYFAGGTAGEFVRHSGRLTVLNWPWNVVLGCAGKPLELELRELQQQRQLLPCRYVGILRCLSSTTGRQPSVSSVSRPVRTDRDGVLKFKVDPPCPGKFYLEIRLLTEDDSFRYNDCCVGYALHCPRGCGGDGSRDGSGYPSGELFEFGPPQPRHDVSDDAGGSSRLQLGCDIAGGELCAPDGETALALTHLNDNPADRRRVTCRVYQQDDRLAPPATAYVSRRGVHFFASVGGGRFALVLLLRNRPVCQFLVLADCGAADADGAAWRHQPQPDWQKLMESTSASDFESGEPFKSTTSAELSVPIGTEERIQRAELLRVAWRPSRLDRRRDGESESDTFLIAAEGAVATMTEDGSSVVCRFRLPGNYLLKLLRPIKSEGDNVNIWSTIRCHPVRVFSSPGFESDMSDGGALDEVSWRLAKRQRRHEAVRLQEQQRCRRWRLWWIENDDEDDEDAFASAMAANEVVACGQLEAAMAAMDAPEIEKCLAKLEPIIARKLAGRACLLLAAIDLKADLRRALELSDVKRLRYLLTELDDLGLTALSSSASLNTAAAAQLVAKEATIARQLIWREGRRARQPRHRLGVNSRSLTELRRYSRPQDAVHSTVQAVLLLLGHYEKRTRKWKRCQPLLREILRDMDNLDLGRVDPRIAARSKQILEGINSDEVQRRSAAASGFYEWGVRTVAAIQRVTPKDEFKPADLRQQAKILGVSPAEDAKYKSDSESGSVSGLSATSSGLSSGTRNTGYAKKKR